MESLVISSPGLILHQILWLFQTFTMIQISLPIIFTKCWLRWPSLDVISAFIHLSVRYWDNINYVFIHPMVSSKWFWKCCVPFLIFISDEHTTHQHAFLNLQQLMIITGIILTEISNSISHSDPFGYSDGMHDAFIMLRIEIRFFRICRVQICNEFISKSFRMGG